MSTVNKIEKYLFKQNPSRWKLTQENETEKYSNIVVIPVISEFEYIKKLIISLQSNFLGKINKTLVLFVVNNKKKDSDDIRNDNLKSINFLKELLNYNNPKLKFGFIDCSTKGCELPEKAAGAGLARKIGMDLALKYFNFENNKKKILISLDADCLVSKNYIQSIDQSFNKKNFSAAVINFEHQLPDDLDQRLAIINYEIFLRYYVLGLKFANSPFAFHTIGSAFAVDPEIYVRVGGMNKRRAGEDFYFLQKIAKIENLNKVVDATVFPSSRISWRVPFGTGPRIQRFLRKQQDEYLVYSPSSFIVLKEWLIVLNNLESELNISDKIKNIHTELYNFLISQNFEKNWNSILKNSKSKKQLKQNIINWMDGFRTLKLIHYLRDNAFPNENMFFSINQLFDLCGKLKLSFSNNEIPELEIQLEFLKQLRLLT